MTVPLRGAPLRVGGSLLLFLLQLPLVERQLVALEDVAVAAAALPGAGGDAREEATALELVLDARVQLLLGRQVLLLRHDVVAPLDLLLALLLDGHALDLLPEVDAVLLEVVLLEGLRVHLHDGVLHEGLRAHQLVAAGVIDDVQDAHLLGAVLGSPREVAAVQPQRPVLHVAAAAANGADALGAQLAVRPRAAHLVLALLLVDVPAAARLAVLVARVAGDSHGRDGWGGAARPRRELSLGPEMAPWPLALGPKTP